MRDDNVLITGASAGLGEALAMSAAQRGANLTLVARRAERLDELKERLVKLYPNIDVLTITADVTNKEHNQEMVAKSVAHFGKIDCFIANAGKSMWCRFKDVQDPDELNNLMQVNYMGVVYGAFYALPHLRKSKGSYVAISSILGAIPILYHSGYSAAKYAVNGFVESLRLEEPEINFLLAMPAWISGTEIRQNALSGTSSDAVTVKKSHNKKVINAKDCAELIIKALLAKKSELYIPKSYRWVPAIRHLIKSTVDKVINAKVSGQIKS